MSNASTIGLKCKHFTKVKINQILLSYLLLSRLATSLAGSNNEAVTNETATSTANGIALSSAAKPPTIISSRLSTIYAWGHNTKYATKIFDENIVVKGNKWLNITYPKADDVHHEYTIIGVHSYAYSDNVDLADVISVHITAGGVDCNFITLRFVSKALDDVKFNLKLFGINLK